MVLFERGNASREGQAVSDGVIGDRGRSLVGGCGWSVVEHRWWGRKGGVSLEG